MQSSADVRQQSIGCQTQASMQTMPPPRHNTRWMFRWESVERISIGQQASNKVSIFHPGHSPISTITGERQSQYRLSGTVTVSIATQGTPRYQSVNVTYIATQGTRSDPMKPSHLWILRMRKTICSRKNHDKRKNSYHMDSMSMRILTQVNIPHSRSNQNQKKTRPRAESTQHISNKENRKIP